jgi:hypothetical protein
MLNKENHKINKNKDLNNKCLTRKNIMIFLKEDQEYDNDLSKRKFKQNVKKKMNISEIKCIKSDVE